MKIYKSCKTLSIFRFYEILDTKDYKYLIDDYENTEITDDLQNDLDNIWSEIFKEYIVLKDDKQIRTSFKKLAYISKLETKLSICISLLNGLVEQTTKEAQKKYIKELSAWGYPINQNKHIQDEINRIIRNFKTLKSSIKIKKNEYNKEYKKELTQEKIDIDEQVVNVEQALNNSIDSNSTTVSKWIYYVKRASSIARKQKAA